MRNRSSFHGILPAFASIAACLLLAAAVAPFAGAQQPPPSAPSAATVASWVQTFYDQTRSMTARFAQRYVNQVYQRTTVSSGRVQFRKPGMMRFDYDAPNGKVVASDGQRLVVFEPADTPGGAGQYYEQPVASAQLPDALSFLTGTGQLAQNYTFRLLDASRLGYPQGQVLELRSRRPTPHYSRILLFVDHDPQRLGIVHRVLIIDSANNRNQFEFTEQRFNTEIAESVFRWQPPRGARRIQP